MEGAILALGLLLSVAVGMTLGFFGGGGSLLMVPLLVYVLGLAPKTAIASSLVVVGVASATGAVHHARVGHVQLRTALWFGAAGMAGAYLGGRAAAYVDAALLLLLFAGMMVLTALAMWRGRATPAPPGGAPSPLRLLAQGLAVGLFTGLVGAGGGFLIVPALTLWGGLSMPTAVGTSLLIIVLNAAAGFAGYLAHVRVDPTLVGGITGAAIAGSLVGARLAHRVEPSSLRRGFAALVLVMAAAIGVREADAWTDTARTALPRSVPQIVFVVAVLALGVAAGRASRRGGADPLADRVFEHGAGI